MQITSLYFILFSLVSIFIYYMLKQKHRIIFLTFLSSAFVASFSYILLAYILLFAFLNYWVALKIPESTRKKSLFNVGVVLNIVQLILLKYVSFTLNPLLGLLGLDFDLRIIAEIIIPVGVSFFTLQAIAYLINVKMAWEKPERNYLHFLLYLIFYPRFLSGPVERSNLFLPQLKIKQEFKAQNVNEGLQLTLIGIFKKVAIANQLAPLINSTYANLNATDENSLLIILLLQPIYIYFDFSGYTDIAIGIARTFGIELRPNFDRPFMAENVTTFWKRFHSSLSSWFHDYIFMRTMYRYRKWGRKASNLALLLTWVLFGIWHGAGWTFMLLGLLQALAIYYETSTKKLRSRLFSVLPSFLRIWIGRIVTYLFYGVSLVFFFSPDIHSVGLFFSSIANYNGINTGSIRLEIFLLVMIFVFVFMLFEVLKTDFSKIYNAFISRWKNNSLGNLMLRWALYFLLITIILIFRKDVQQFIYFQF